MFSLILDQFVTHGTDFEEGLSLLVQALALRTIERGFPQDTEHCSRPEIIFVVEAMNGAQDFIRRQTGILDVGQLMAALVHHFGVCQKAIFHRVVIELGTRIGVRYRDLDGFDVELFGERDSVVDGFARLTGQAKDEVAVNDQSELVAIFGELARPLNRGALLDIFQDLLVAGFITDDQQAATGLFHRF